MGAKFTGTGIAPDEHQQITLDMDYDGKRDRWNGYDPDDHMRIVEEYSKVDLVSSCKRACSLNCPPLMDTFVYFGGVFAIVMLDMLIAWSCVSLIRPNVL